METSQVITLTIAFIIKACALSVALKCKINKIKKEWSMATNNATPGKFQNSAKIKTEYMKASTAKNLEGKLIKPSDFGSVVAQEHEESWAGEEGLIRLMDDMLTDEVYKEVTVDGKLFYVREEHYELF